MSLQLAIDDGSRLQNIEVAADHTDSVTESRTQQTEV